MKTTKRSQMIDPIALRSYIASRAALSDSISCPHCADVIDYEPQHEAEQDTGVGYWPGGYLCATCGFAAVEVSTAERIEVRALGDATPYARRDEFLDE